MKLELALLLLLTACTEQGSPRPSPTPPIDVRLAQIVEIRIVPEPEGPISPAFELAPREGARSLSEISDFVPLPLPLEIPQSCTLGGTLFITLSNGQEIAYGPCKRPIEIDRLWWHMLDVLSDETCRPNCWPGGQSPPGEPMPPDAPSH